MTLLESLIAFVLLAVVGVACLELSQGALGLETTSVAWTRAVARADAALEASAAPDGRNAFPDVRIERRPWRGATMGEPVEQVDVYVPVGNGREFHLSRLVQAAPRSNAR